MARGLPRGRAPPLIPERRRRLGCASPRLRGERTQERCCPRQSCAATLVAQLANLFPGGASDGRLQPLALERRLAETELAAPLRSASMRRSPCSTRAFNVVCSRRAALRASSKRLSGIWMVVFIWLAISLITARCQTLIAPLYRCKGSSYAGTVLESS